MSTAKIDEELARGANLSIINLVDHLIQCAHTMHASDIHIDPIEQNLRIRFRIDGVLLDVFLFPKKIHSEIISRIKVLAGLRTDEHQAGQDGRFRSSCGRIDMRVSIIPTYYGENVVLRLLSHTAQASTLAALGFSDKDIEKILRAIEKPHGMILATGPTGSGKTTTLYTLISLLRKKEISIVTIEDPIEYAMENVKQIQVNARSGLTFANGLRYVLRQDPNIIMVGEIRDPETAMIAVNTSLTGHLLLSTLHTNDAATTLPRLLDMKIDTYLIASTIQVVIGQRLVRKICVECKTERTITDVEHKSLKELLSEITIGEERIFYYGRGCDVCKGSGYVGRIGVNEVLVADADIREAILRKVSALEIKNIAIKNGMGTMLMDGWTKVRKGITTIEEVVRVLHG